MTSISSPRNSTPLAGHLNGSTPVLPKAARIALSMLSKIDGLLHIELPDGRSMALGQAQSEPSEFSHATIKLHNWRVFTATLRDGDIGFAESYIRGDWSTDDLTRLLCLLVANRDRLEKAVYGSWIGGTLNRLRHLLKPNTRRGAKRNIHAHYDIGNDFYKQWLDPSMTYSSALFSPDARDLEQAQDNKYRRIVDELDCKSGADILEVGCGWGGFAQIAARQGLSVHGLTLSEEQASYARQRMARHELTESTDILVQDYRDETNRYDGIVSIEMFEAVGQAYWPTYFQTLHRCLKPGAKAVVQTITIADTLFERYSRGSDFIQQYIFPGGMLPSVFEFEKAANAAGLKVLNRHGFGQDYAQTLSIWHEKFEQQAEPITQMGFDRRFKRTWRFYLAYCEAAFRCQNTDVYQFTLTRDE